MNQTIQKLGFCAFACLFAAGCSSSTSTPAPAAKSTATAPPSAPTPIAAAPAAPKKLVCTGKANDDTQGADVEESALYVLMNSKLGGWSSCTQKKLNKTDEEQLVTFTGGATLTVSSYPSSDASTEEAVLPAGTAITATM